MQVIAPTNQRLAVKDIAVFGRGIVSTDPPILFRILRQTTAGTVTGVTPVALGVVTETLTTTAGYAATGTEPTAGAVLFVGTWHPQSGYEHLFPYDQEILVPGGGRLGLELTSGAAVNVRCTFIGEE